MPRQLRPCGTTAAYSRHLYNKEEPCDACKEANTSSKANAPSGANYWGSHWDKVIADDPPVIVWRLDPVSRIQVAVSVDDPHAETTSDVRNRNQLAYYAKRAAAQAEERTRPRTNLLAAARTDI